MTQQRVTVDETIALIVGAKQQLMLAGQFYASGALDFALMAIQKLAADVARLSPLPQESPPATD